MGPILPGPVTVPHKPQPRFVDERRRLERLPCCLLRHARNRDASQLLIDEREQLLRSLSIAPAHRVQH